MAPDDEYNSPKSEDVVFQGFDWRNIVPEKLLANSKYRELYKRQNQRQNNLQSKTDISDDEFWNEFKEINRLNDVDERQSLEGNEQLEFQYFSKYETLEMMKDDVDPVMYPISREFNRLPFTIHQTCSGHVDNDSGNFTENSYDSIVFVSHQFLSADEKEAQRNFIDNLADLDLRICERLGIDPYNILDITAELTDDDGENVTVYDLLEQGRELTLRLNIDPAINTNPTTVLTTVWDETAKYIAKTIDKPAVSIDFNNGKVFEK